MNANQKNQGNISDRSVNSIDSVTGSIVTGDRSAKNQDIGANRSVNNVGAVGGDIITGDRSPDNQATGIEKIPPQQGVKFSAAHWVPAIIGAVAAIGAALIISLRK